MNILMALLFVIYPHLRIETMTDSTGPYIVVHAPNTSTDFTLYVSDLSYAKDSILNFSYPDFDLWDRKKTEDSIFVFRPTGRRKFKKNTLYMIRASVFDLVEKNTIASAYYFFRLNRRGKIGLAPSLYPVMQLLSEDTIGIFFESNKPCFASITLLFKNKNPKTVLHNKKTKRHEFRIPYKKGLEYYRFTLFTKYDTFVSRTIPVKYRGKIERFAIFGDTRANWAIPSPLGRTDGVNEEVINKILRAIYKENPDFVEINGDLITGYTSDRQDALIQYYAFLKALYPYASSLPFLFTPGNHDLTAPMEGDRKNHKDPSPPESAEDLWASVFMQPENGPVAKKGMPPYRENVFYIKAGEWGLFFLNSDYNYAKKNRKRISGNITFEETQWFYEKQKRFKNTIVIFHEPLYSNTEMPGHSLDYDIAHRDSVAKVFFNSNVKLILTSHEHLYARRKVYYKNTGKWLYQTTIGAGGAPIYNIPVDKRKNLEYFSRETVFGLVSIKGHSIVIRIKNLNGFVVDKFEVK